MPNRWEARVAETGRSPDARSLFGEILDWMFAPLLLLWPISVSLTYLVAQSIAEAPYDRALLERARALGEHVQFEGPPGAPRARLDLPAAALEPLVAGEAGAYLVLAPGGGEVAGDIELPHALPSVHAPPGAFQLRDGSLHGHDVRIAYGWIAPPVPAGAAPGPSALVQVAETLDARRQLANEIIKGVILPQFLVLPLALLLVWFGLTRGLAPLARLQEKIRSRRPDDLAPIPQGAAPEEIAPLVDSFNELLARMRRNLEMQRRFIADAAHQMKTPLAGLRTQAELAHRQGDPVELQESLRQIATSTDRATRLINQLLALARAEHGAGEAAAQVRLDLDALVRSVVHDWVPQALAHRIDLGYEGADRDGDAIEGGCAIRGAPVLLRELANNLIDNALRYSTVGSGEDSGTEGTVTVRVRREGAQVLLEVEDNGPGVPAEERERIFERFFRVLGNARDGSGLGLAIVREIAAQHGATVGVAPARGAGPRPGALFQVRFAGAAG